MDTPARSVHKQIIASIPLERAWKTWTSNEGVTSFFAPKANVDAAVGGPYELFFDLKAPRGFQGTEGCKILSLEPPIKLGFEFLAPPQFPNVRRIRTRVDVLLEYVLSGGIVKTTLTHSGFLEGEEWDECLDFFNWSWELVLGRFQHRFSAGPVDWNNPFIPLGIPSRPQRKLRDHISPQGTY